MKKAGFTPKRDFTVLMMRCEESSFYGKSYIGSLAFTGKLTPDVTELTDRTKEKTLGEHMRECGFDPEKLTTGKSLMDLKKIAAFVELHIEQGPTLTSSETVRTGIVTGIRGNIRHKQVKIIGETAHLTSPTGTMRFWRARTFSPAWIRHGMNFWPQATISSLRWAF